MPDAGGGVGELALICRANGLDAAPAAALARRISDSERGLDTLAGESWALTIG